MTPTRTDEDLVRLAAAGDPTAGSELARRIYPGLLSVARRLCGNDDAARDAAQETFLRAFRNLGDIAPESRFAPWVFRILVNHLRDRWRKHEPELEDVESTEGGPGPLDLILKREDLDCARAAIDRLPSDWKLAVLLCYGQGLNAREVGETMGITHAAARLKLSRAIRRIRDEVAR